MSSKINMHIYLGKIRYICMLVFYDIGYFYCYLNNVAIFIMAIGIFILQMVQAWYILLNACSICTMKIPSTTMKIALSYIYVSYTYIFMYYKHYFLVFSYNAKSSAGFVFFYSIKLSSVHFLSWLFFRYLADPHPLIRGCRSARLRKTFKIG